MGRTDITKTINIMKTKKNARRVAYEAKQEKEGRKVVEWIIGALIVLAVIYAVWASIMIA